MEHNIWIQEKVYTRARQKDESLEETENLPEVLAAEIIENLKAALEEFEALQEELESKE